MNRFRPHLLALFLVTLTFAVFWPVRHHEFVWDDHRNILENPHLNPVTGSHFFYFWQQPHRGLYIPLTYTVWAAIVPFAKLPSKDDGKARLDPGLFHIANLIVHLLSVLGVLAILRLLVRNDWAAAGGALLFALHPVQVEPVAWVTGMKDVLSGFFAIMAVWQYLAHAVAPSVAAEKFHYVLATVAFVLAMLAKPAAVIVPIIAGILDYWLLKRPLRQVVAALAVWIVLVLPFTVVTKWVQPDAELKFVTPLWARPLVAADAVGFYFYKLAVPLWLGPDYGRTPEWVLGKGWPYLAWLVPFGSGVVIWLWRQGRPWLMVSAGVFVAGMLPVSGLIPFRFQEFSTVADRYLYLSMLGPALALAWFLARGGRAVSFPVLIFGLILGLLGVASALQLRIWRNGEALFSHSVQINSRSWSGHYNLGNAVARKRMAAEATAHYQEALRAKPDYPDAHNNLGIILVEQGKVDEAMKHYREALRIDPAFIEAHYNLGTELAKQGELEEAIGHFREALRIDPDHVKARNNLAAVLVRRGELREAVGHFRAVLRLHPTDAKIRMNLANVLAKSGKLEEAIDHYRKVLEHKPEFAPAHEALGRALTLQGRRDEAVEHLEKAIEILKAGSAGTARTAPDRLSPRPKSGMESRMK